MGRQSRGALATAIVALMIGSAAAYSSLPYYASCARGLEKVLEEELLDPKVEFDGPSAAVAYRATLECRVANRVMEKLSWGPARTSDDVYALTQRVLWREKMYLESTLSAEAVLGDRVSPALTHSHFTALTVKNAVVDAFRARLGARPSVDGKEADVPLVLYVHRDEAILYRALSPGSLHKRGYRSEMHAASLKETVASGVLALAGVTSENARVLCDPMCGSGTLAIEAALIGRRIAPGLTRLRAGIPFSPARWKDFDEDAWRQALDAAEARVLPRLAGAIFASDVHAGSLNLARADAARAGVFDGITFTEADASTVVPRLTPTTVVSNPPWDMRLGDADASWRAMGDFLRQRCPGATAHLLTGNMPVSRELRMRASSKKKIAAGGVDLRLLRYEVYQQEDREGGVIVEDRRDDDTGLLGTSRLLKHDEGGKKKNTPPSADAFNDDTAPDRRGSSPRSAASRPPLLYADLTVVELKDVLRARRLRVSGRKQELVERLEEHDSLAPS